MCCQSRSRSVDFHCGRPRASHQHHGWTTIKTMGAERTSYCVACDLVVTWTSWRMWQRHVQSPEHRESLVAPKPLPPERVRPADVVDRQDGCLAEGESARDGRDRRTAKAPGESPRRLLPVPLYELSTSE
jgi:hypothetical protein